MQTTTIPHKTEPAWYRQFWPWFLIMLPATVVVASVITIYLAVSNADPIIKHNDQKLGPVITKSQEQ